MHGRDQSPGVLRRPQQVRRFDEAFELVGRDEGHVSSAATTDDYDLPSLGHVVAKRGKVGPRVGIGGVLWHLLSPYRLSVRTRVPRVKQTCLRLLEEARQTGIALDPEPITWCRDALRTAPLVAAELTHEVAIRSRQLDGFHGRDPIDRFLVATCLVAEMTLVTRDAAIRRYRRIRTLW